MYTKNLFGCHTIYKENKGIEFSKNRISLLLKYSITQRKETLFKIYNLTYKGRAQMGNIQTKRVSLVFDSRINL